MLRGESIVQTRPTVPTFPGNSVRAWVDVPESAERSRSQSSRPSAELRPGAVDWETLLNGIHVGRAHQEYQAGRTIFAQGGPADALYVVLRGHVKLTVVSHNGKGAIVATLGPGEFFGEGCMIGRPRRTATATAMSACRVTRVEKAAMVRVLHDSPEFADAFMASLMTRIISYEADLVDHMFNSSAKRLARVLLRLSRLGEHCGAEAVVAGVNQEQLAQMVGSTRPRINQFMTTFRKMGFITYSAQGSLTVHRSLHRVIEAD